MPIKHESKNEKLHNGIQRPKSTLSKTNRLVSSVDHREKAYFERFLGVETDIRERSERSPAPCIFGKSSNKKKKLRENKDKMN